jgi:integrase
MNAEFKNTLTLQESISYLLGEENEIMKGTIRTKDKCQVCKGKFTEIKKVGFLCPEHKTKPDRFFIDFSHEGQRFKLYSDTQGQILDSYRRAVNLISRVSSEIERHTFDPTRYVKQELEKYYVGRLLDGFLEYKLTGDNIAPSYVRHYRRYVGIARDYFGMRDVRDLRKMDIVNYQAHVSNNYNFGSKTLKNCIDIFKTFLIYLKNDLELLSVVPHFPVIDVPAPITTWLAPDMQKMVFSYVPKSDKPIIAFLMLSGSRPGEARALKCKDVDLESKLITISATFSDATYRPRRKGKKSKQAIIPIHQEIFAHFKQRVENNMPEAFIFVTETGIHYSESRLQRMWSMVREKAGLDKSVRLYDAARHSFASQLINSGVSIYNVSNLLGHSNIKTTEKYLHSDLDKLQGDVSNVSLKDKIVNLPDSVPRPSPEVKYSN